MRTFDFAPLYGQGMEVTVGKASGLFRTMAARKPTHRLAEIAGLREMTIRKKRLASRGIVRSYGTQAIGRDDIVLSPKAIGPLAIADKLQLAKEAREYTPCRSERSY